MENKGKTEPKSLDSWFKKYQSSDYGKTKVSSMAFGSLRFQSLYQRSHFTLRYSVVIISALITSVFVFFLLQGTGIFNLGISGILQGFSRLVAFLLHQNNVDDHSVQIVYKVLFWILYFLFNIPFAIFGYKKVGKQFAIITIFSIAVSTVVGLILSFIPQLKNFYIFSNPTSYNEDLAKNGVQILTWSQSTIREVDNQRIVLYDSSRIVIILIYGFLAGLLPSLSSTFTYLVGGSNGGTDWFVFYYSKKTLKSFASLSMYLNLFLLWLSFIIGTYIPYAVVMKQNENISTSILISNFFAPTLMANIFSAFIKRNVLNWFYPQFKPVIVKIYTDKIYEIRADLINNQFAHAFTINNAIGGYSLQKKSNIEVVCFYYETPFLTKIIRSHDRQCLIVASPITAMTGNFRIRSTID